MIMCLSITQMNQKRHPYTSTNKTKAKNKEGYKGINGMIFILLFNIEGEKWMAAYYPPTNFFQNINFNNDFYAIPNNNQGISLSYANTHYLFSTGVATSTAIIC